MPKNSAIPSPENLPEPRYDDIMNALRRGHGLTFLEAIGVYYAASALRTYDDCENQLRVLALMAKYRFSPIHMLATHYEVTAEVMVSDIEWGVYSGSELRRALLLELLPEKVKEPSQNKNK